MDTIILGKLSTLTECLKLFKMGPSFNYSTTIENLYKELLECKAETKEELYSNIKKFIEKNSSDTFYNSVGLDYLLDFYKRGIEAGVPK